MDFLKNGEKNIRGNHVVLNRQELWPAVDEHDVERLLASLKESPASLKEMINLLKKLQTEYGQTIIMVTHDMNIADCADTIVRIEDGMIIK